MHLEKELKRNKTIDFKKRIIVQYSLIICVLLIQLLIGFIFYNEFKHQKSIQLIENHQKDIKEIEALTNQAQDDINAAQLGLINYYKTSDAKEKDVYFNALNNLNQSFDKIFQFNQKHPSSNYLNQTSNHLKSHLDSVKVLIDTTKNQVTTQALRKEKSKQSSDKFNKGVDLKKYDVQTKVYKGTVKKKGLIGRIGDAIKGNVSTRKDSTVVILKNKANNSNANLEKEVQTIVKETEKHYLNEINQLKSVPADDILFSGFNQLFNYSNHLLGAYDNILKDSNAKLEKELALQNSKNKSTREFLLWGLLAMMFIVTLLILYFTRIAFLYETQLNAANQEIKENLSFKNRILGMLSHEIRSPLKIIGLFINRIDKRTDDPQVKEYLKSISFTNDSLLIQSNQILSYTKDQKIELKIIPEVFDLKEEIDKILSSIQPYIASRNNELIVQNTIEPLLLVDSDKAKIHQIFINILGNANKFTENGQIKVKTESIKFDQETLVLKAEIQDSGLGISQEDLKNIFEPYYQGVISKDVENIGAGLGLSLCKEIIHLFSGEISVKSELKKGTIVSFSCQLKIKSNGKV